MTSSRPNPIIQVPHPYSREQSTELSVGMSSSFANWVCNGEKRMHAQIDTLLTAREILVLYTRKRKPSLIFSGCQYGIHRKIRN
jgi:hypothetical protein